LSFMHFSYLIFGYAILIIADGVIFQLAAPQRDPAILMPVIFGGILIIMGFMSLNSDLKLFGRHGATALSLIAFIYSVNNFAELFRPTFSSNFYVNSANAIMSVFSLLFLILAVIRFGKDRQESSDKN